MSLPPVEIVDVPAQHTACIHATVAMPDIQREMPQLLTELQAAVEASGQQVVGPWFNHHREPPREFFHFDICFPVPHPVAVSGRVVPVEWPARRVARTVHTGPYEELAAAWRAFLGEVKGRGLRVPADFFERYLVPLGPAASPAELQTELSIELLEAS